MPLSKMLFIGCGGSGLDTIRLVRRQLEQRLSLVGVPRDRFPAAWQFVNIDVPVADTATDQSLLDTQGIEYVSLTSSGMTYRPPRGIETILAGEKDRQQNQDFVQWRPNPARATFSITEGAGNVRAFGRAIGAYSLDETAVDRLKAAIDRMNDPTDAAGLGFVEQRLGMAPANQHESRAVIVSSLGGGAGSGIFIDVADSLRLLGAGQWLDQSIAFLYEPSVFEAETTAKINGIPPNSLMALAEMVAGQINPYWATPYISAATEGQIDRRGPQIPILVSRQNMTNSSASIDRSDAYKVTADLLTTLTMSTDISQKVWGGLATNLMGFPGASELMKSERPWGFFGMGCSRITTGHEIFALYAAERMTRSALELASSLGQDNTDVEVNVRQGKTTRQAEIDRIISGVGTSHGDLSVEFLRRCGLDERGESNNQVIDYLFDALAAVTDQTKQSLKSLVLTKLTGGGQSPKDGTTIWGQIYDALQSSGIVVLKEDWEAPALLEALQQGIDRWSADLQVRILDTVTAFVFEYGIHATSAVVDGIADQLLTQIPGQIRQEVKDISEPQDSPLQKLYAKLSDKQYRKTSVDAVQRDIDLHLDAWVAHLEQRDVRSEAAALLADLAINVFTPITRALLVAKGAMERDLESRIEGLSDESVAPHLKPSRAQILLTPVSEFPAVFDRLVTANQTRDRQPVKDAFQGRYDPGTDLDADSRLDDTDQQAAWNAKTRWAPGVTADKRTGASTGSVKLAVSFDFTLDGVLHRCTEWLRSPASPTHSFVSENIRSFVLDEAGGGAAKEERAQQFATRLAEALAVAPPKVNLDVQYLEAELEVTEVVNWDQVTVPFSADELGVDATARIVALLGSQGISDAEKRFVVPSIKDVGEVRELPIFSVTRAFTPESVAPLAGQVAANFDTSSRVDFWLGRRARPLPQAISLPGATIRQIARGWITARLLDVVDIEATERTCTLTDPTDGTRYEMVTSVPGFDGPAEAAIESWEYLGGALEAAFLSHLYYRFGRPEGWDALRLLFRLGSSGGEEFSSDYPNVNPALTGLALPGLTHFAPAADLAGALDVVIEDFSGPNVKIVPTEKWQRIPLHHQMSVVIVEAAQQIRNAQAADPDGGSTHRAPVRG